MNSTTTRLTADGAVKDVNRELRQLSVLPNLFWGVSEVEAVSKILAGNCSTPILGQFSLVHEDDEMLYLIRDRLGLNKLFYHIDASERRVTVGHYLHEVAGITSDYNRVLSVPAGHYLAINRKTLQTRLVSYWDLGRVESDPQFDIDQFHQEVDRRLSKFFVEFKQQFHGCRFVVCLSGGLDSSIIAAYARQYLDNVTAVTFSYENLSDDFRSAEAIARELGLAFLPAVVEKKTDDEVLDDVLRYGQDSRDFNMHCAWVNHHIARHLHGAFAKERVVVLTGDLMNEFVADYAPEDFGGKTYYRLPNISRERLRRFLIYGLDAGDRELGIFHRYDLTTVQPYSGLAELYLKVPNEYLIATDCKERLNLPLVANTGIRDFLLEKKTRAQVGGSDGGTLGLFHQAGINQEDLNRRWIDIFQGTAREPELKPIIVSGRYRN